MKISYYVVLLTLLSGVTANVIFHPFSAPARSAASEQMPAVPVGASTVVYGDVPIYLFGLGNVQAYNSVLISAQIDGQISEIAFREGQQVKAGDVLFKLDGRAYQAHVGEARGKLAQDQAQLTNSRRNLERSAALISKNFVTRQDFDTNQARVEQYEAAVSADEATVEFALVGLGWNTIRSPIDGRVGKRLIDQGNMVHAHDTGVVVVTQTQPIYVSFTLPEDVLQSILKGMAQRSLPATALSRDGKQQLDQGELTLIDNHVDETTGTIQLKATFSNTAGLLWPGQFIMARLQVGTQNNVAIVPVNAVQSGPQGSFVFVVNKEGAAELRSIKLGAQTADTAVIEAGLQAGELVVTSGQYRLQKGSKVEIIPDGPVLASKQDSIEK
jgi:membrane fusion protein, multidrug efflux system